MKEDDATLVRRYAETRDEPAFAELVRRHLEIVYSGALRRVGGDTHLAKDVTQQVFVALARKAGAVAGNSSLSSWLHIATRNEAADIVRTERRRKAREYEVLIMQAADSPPGSHEEWSQMAPVLDAAIDQLNEADRAAVLMRFMHHRSFAEIGLILNLSDDAARMRVDRALEKMRVRMERSGLRSSAAALSAALTSHAVVAAPTSLAAIVTASAPLAATAGMWIGLVTFMGTTKWIAGIIGSFAVVAAIGTAGYQWKTKQQAEHSRNAALSEYRSIQAIHDERLRTAALFRDQAAALERQLTTAKAEHSQRLEEASKAADAAPWDPVAEGHAYMKRNPEVGLALTNYVKANLRYRNAPLYQDLRLTPAEIEKFEQIWGSGFGMGASSINGDVSLRFTGVESGSDRSQLTKELLGGDRLKIYNAFLLTRLGREFVTEVAGSLVFSAAPMTSLQAEQLAQVVVGSWKSVAGSTRAERDWDAILTKSAAFLSPPQVEALAGRRAGEEFHRVLNRPRGEKIPEAKGGVR